MDLFNGSDVRIKLYAVDIKVYLGITNDIVCATLLLHYYLIDRIFEWSHSWQLKLANNKYQHSRIGLSRAVCSANYCLSCKATYSPECS